MIVSLPTIVGVYLIIAKVLQISDQASDLFETETDIDLNINVSRETLLDILHETYLEDFFEKAFSDGLLFYLPGDSTIHTRPRTFKTEDVIRIFETYLDPLEKINLLVDLSVYLIYPIIKAYWKMTGLQGQISLPNWKYFFDAIGYILELLNTL